MCVHVRMQRSFALNRCTGTAASYQARRKKEAYASSDVDKTITFGVHGYWASPKPSGSGQKCREEITKH